MNISFCYTFQSCRLRRSVSPDFLALTEKAAFSVYALSLSLVAMLPRNPNREKPFN